MLAMHDMELISLASGGSLTVARKNDEIDQADEDFRVLPLRQCLPR